MTSFLLTFNLKDKKHDILTSKLYTYASINPSEQISPHCQPSYCLHLVIAPVCYKLYGWNYKQHISKKCQAQRRQQPKQIIHQVKLYLVTLATKIYYKIYMPSRKIYIWLFEIQGLQQRAKDMPSRKAQYQVSLKKNLMRTIVE